MLPAKTGSAMCVQNFDDSRSLAIRITYRISLRSSSLWDPRHPLLKVVMNYTVKRQPEGRPRTVLVQFQFCLVLGGTEAITQPVRTGDCQGTWVFDLC